MEKTSIFGQTVKSDSETNMDRSPSSKRKKKLEEKVSKKGTFR